MLVDVGRLRLLRIVCFLAIASWVLLARCLLLLIFARRRWLFVVGCVGVCLLLFNAGWWCCCLLFVVVNWY